MSIFNVSDFIGERIFGIQSLKNYDVDDVALDSNTRIASVAGLAAKSRKYSRDGDHILRTLRFFEPLCLALVVGGISIRAAKAQNWIKSTRTLVTVFVRVPKAWDAFHNPKIKKDATIAEKVFQTIAGPAYASLALAGLVAEAGKQGILPISTNVTWFLTYGGTAGNVLAGTGGFYSWYRDSQRVFSLRDAAGDNAKAIKEQESSRFWNGCNGIRYGLDAVFGVMAISGGPFTEWGAVATKLAPASVGVGMTVARVYFGW